MKNKITIIEAVARGWCHPTNSHKVMDTDLAMAIADEVEKVLPVLMGKRGGQKTASLYGTKHFSDAGKKGAAKRWKEQRKATAHDEP